MVESSPAPPAPKSGKPLFEKAADFISHLRATDSALRLDAAMQARGNIDRQTLDAILCAPLDPLVSLHAGGTRLRPKGHLLRHAASIWNRLVESSSTTALISTAAGPSGVSSNTVLPRAALSANATRWQTAAANT